MTENIPENESTQDIQMSGNLYRLQLSSNSWRLKRFKEILNSFGIKSVKYRTPEHIDSLKYEALTLLILPNITGLNTIPQGGYFTKEGFRVGVQNSYSELEAEHIKFSYNNWILADYYKNRNLIICNVDLFMTPYSVNYFKMVTEFIFDGLELKQNPPLKIEIAPEEKLAVAARNFTYNIRNTIVKIDNEISFNRREIERAGKLIIDSDNKVRTGLVQQSALKLMITNSSEEFAKKVNELKDVNFLESYSIEKEYILLDYGKIDIEVNKINYYIGKFKAKIYPTKVEFVNYDFAGEYDAIHPHIRQDGSACFGTYQDEISKLQSSLEFKKLAFILKQFLHTWNSKSPIRNIREWEAINKRREVLKLRLENKNTKNTVTSKEESRETEVQLPIKRITISAQQRDEFLRRVQERRAGL
jgi:hypothetical protein